MRVYISGAIMGMEGYEKKFAAKAKELRSLGYEVVNPVVMGKKLRAAMSMEPSHEDYMRYLIPILLKCDGISFLDNWEGSEGARVEHDVAVSCGIPTLDFIYADNKEIL